MRETLNITEGHFNVCCFLLWDKEWRLCNWCWMVKLFYGMVGVGIGWTAIIFAESVHVHITHSHMNRAWWMYQCLKFKFMLVVVAMLEWNQTKHNGTVFLWEIGRTIIFKMWRDSITHVNPFPHSVHDRTICKCRFMLL